MKMRVTLLFVAAMVFLFVGGCEMDAERPSLSAASAESQEESEQSESEMSFVSTAEPYEDVDKPSMHLEKMAYKEDETVCISYQNTDEKDWIGFYAEGADPGTVYAIVWKYTAGEAGTVEFPASQIGNPGNYWVFLCDNDGYKVLDMKEITLLDNDPGDYGVQAAYLRAESGDGGSHIEIDVDPSSELTLDYRFYWSRNNVRLEDYEPIYTVSHSGSEAFTVVFNDCLFMPDDADGIEISVNKGASSSYYIDVSDEWKAPASQLLYKFNVLTDLHIIADRPQHVSHLSGALADIIAQGGSTAIFTVGDNTDQGTEADYALLLETIEGAGALLPDVYYAVGNHDIVYNNGAGYDRQIALFCEKTGMPGAYYAVEINGTHFIVLGSDTAVGEGTVGEAQLAWLRTELAKTDPNEPVFCFLHQPLIDTVSGSLYSQDNEIQDWYGIVQTADEIREILKGYPNALLFSGHTHWTLESKQPILYGCGRDATFVNCAAVGYLWNDQDEAAGGSEGYYVEVYEDYILLRGREFLKGKWCAAAQFLIPVTRAAG